jgi:hypothetical protein
MFLPPQGFRHAVVLLLTNGIRRNQPARELAEELVALADDMKARAEAAAWVAAEYERLIGSRFPEPELLRRIGQRRAETAPRDLFLIYVPEDRLSVAGPLAVELAKRRIGVAFSEYEVASSDELEAAVERGLARNRAGALLVTPEFDRKPWRREPDHPRLLILRDVSHPGAIADQLAAWLSSKQFGDSLP